MRGDGRRSFLLTLIAVLAVAAFLSPMLRSFTYAIKSTDQISQAGTPLYPADPVTFEYQGKELPILQVPIDGTTRAARPASSPAASRARSSIRRTPARRRSCGSARGGRSSTAWQFAPHWENFAKVWDLIDYPRLLFNTAMIAIIGTIGTLLSCTLVAYGFARFQFPGRNLLFTLLIATIFLPAAVTIIPTYTIFSKLGWVGTWLPLLVPDVLRQRLRRLPDAPVLHDDPDRDGRGGRDRRRRARSGRSGRCSCRRHGRSSSPSRSSTSSTPGTTSSGRSSTLPGTPDLQTVALGLQRFNGIHYRDPGLIQAGTLMTLIIPVVAFLLTQRFFTRGIVITGVDK